MRTKYKFKIFFRDDAIQFYMGTQFMTSYKNGEYDNIIPNAKVFEAFIDVIHRNQTNTRIYNP